MTVTRTMIVGRIDRQAGRTLLYGNSLPDYHVIASVDCAVKIGDTIVYEPYGYNFGWYVEVKHDADR